MKLFKILMVVFVAGCAQLTHTSDSTPAVVIMDANQKLMSINCSGPANDWGVCYNVARKACVSGYEVTDKVETPRGGTRVLTFRCK